MVVKAWWPVRYRWGVVALGVVAEIKTSDKKGKKGMILIVHIKTHNRNSRCGNLSNTYTKPTKFSVQ